jgi:hypothetical protein
MKFGVNKYICRPRGISYEGTLGEGVIRNLIADMFWVLRFPTHSLLLDYIEIKTAFFPIFFFGLLLNCLFYGWLIERIVFLLKRN